MFYFFNDDLFLLKSRLQTLSTLYPQITKLRVLSNQVESLIQNFGEKMADFFLMF